MAIDDFFLSRINQMIGLRHPLAVLTSHMLWQEIEAFLAHHFAHKVRAGKVIEVDDLFVWIPHGSGLWWSLQCRPSQTADPFDGLVAESQDAFNESDEGVVERWSETTTSRYFSGMDCSEQRLHGSTQSSGPSDR